MQPKIAVVMIRRMSILGAERDKHQAMASKTNAALRKRLDGYQARELRMAVLEDELEAAIRAMRWVVKLHGPAALGEQKT